MVQKFQLSNTFFQKRKRIIKFLKNNIINFYKIIEKIFNISLCGEFYMKENESLFKKNIGLSFIRNKYIYLNIIPKNFKFDLLYSEVDI